MTSPVATVFGRIAPKPMDLDRPEGCDHDRNTYYYRLVDGVMVLRGIALGPRWESRPMNWQGLSCYKRKEDDKVAKKKEIAAPEDLTEIFEACGKKAYRVSTHYHVGYDRACTWLREAGLVDENNKPIEVVQELPDKATEVVTAPLGVEVPQYEPSDNDYIPEDEIPTPYIATPNPLDAQIDIMLDALWSEKRAKLKAHLKPLLADAEAWEMVKCIVSRGLA